MKDVGRLQDGSLFAPKYIENKLKFFPEIREAVAFGDGRDFVCALSTSTSWRWRVGRSGTASPYGSYQELAAHADVARMFERIDEVNRDLAREPTMAACQVRRFLILHKELDADDGELTRTQKVRRSAIAERYCALIEALYDGATEVFAETEMTFEDGREGRIAACVAIHDLAPNGAPRILAEAAE